MGEPRGCHQLAHVASMAASPGHRRMDNPVTSSLGDQLRPVSIIGGGKDHVEHARHSPEAPPGTGQSAACIGLPKSSPANTAPTQSGSTSTATRWRAVKPTTTSTDPGWSDRISMIRLRVEIGDADQIVSHDRQRSSKAVAVVGGDQRYECCVRCCSTVVRRRERRSRRRFRGLGAKVGEVEVQRDQHAVLEPAPTSATSSGRLATSSSETVSTPCRASTNLSAAR